jgi:hypothetical protein
VSGARDVTYNRRATMLELRGFDTLPVSVVDVMDATR